MSIGERGPLLLQDYILHEKLAHFNRERIPERVVHAKGTGAYGTLTITHDITQYTRAKIFEKIGNRIRLFIRFSTVGGEKGSSDTERDPRGFAIKFYTKEGNWDLVGNNTPVFFIKDPKKFPDFIHTQKRNPRSNCKDATMMWDFWSLNPESLHQVMFLMSDRGIPYSYRHMNGYGSHAFSFINFNNECFYVKFHFKTLQGIKNFTDLEAIEMKGKDSDHAQRDLVESIDNKNFPKWAFKIQIMKEKDSKKQNFNPFDVTKIWPHSNFPLIDVGIIELNEIPNNYFAEVEQAAFSPAHVIDGIDYSPDKMLQGRLLSYPDAHRYRLGVNYEQIPVNRCPFMVNNYQRDGFMRIDGNSGSSVNYYPNSFDEIYINKNYKDRIQNINAKGIGWYDRNGIKEDDHYSQPSIFWKKVLNTKDKKNLIQNIINSINGITGYKKNQIIYRQLFHFFKIDNDFGMQISQGLSINTEEIKKYIKNFI